MPLAAVRERAAALPAPVLVLGSIISAQYGSTLAALLIPSIGVGGTVLLRLFISAVILAAAVRPAWRGHSRRAWLTIIAFGVIIASMNFTFYSSLAVLPLGVLVTISFLGPLGLAAATSRRGLDVIAVVTAALGVVFISGALTAPWASLDWYGLGLALLAGAFWVCYILLSRRTGAEVPHLDGLAIAFCIASVLVMPVGVPTIPGWALADVGVGVAVAIFASALPYSLELMALRRLRAGVFGILMSLQPAVAALAGFVVLSERLAGLQLVGIALVVLSSVLITAVGRGSRRRRYRDAPTVAP